MEPQKYTDSEKYQQEIAAQYKKRIAKFSNNEVSRVLQSLGITDVDPNSIQEAMVGNVNATYLTPKFVIKMNQNKEHPDYLPNKIVSDKLSSKYPVVKVVIYDFFEKTDYEVLIMERASGTLLLDDFLELENASQIILFKEILEVVKQFFTIKFENFGSINNLENEQFNTYTNLLKNKFKQYALTIREKKLCDEKDIEKVEKYFLENINIFDNEKPVFVHTDLHMGNILHNGSELTAIIDFDSAQRAPKMCTLVSLLGLIDNPSQFVEGTKDFSKYKGKNFYHFLPVLKESLFEVFADQTLLRKLNLAFIITGMMWIADNWSADWNKEMMQKIIDNEQPNSEQELNKTYFGKVLTHTD